MAPKPIIGQPHSPVAADSNAPAFVQEGCIAALADRREGVSDSRGLSIFRDNMLARLAEIPRQTCNKHEGAFTSIPNISDYSGESGIKSPTEWPPADFMRLTWSRVRARCLWHRLSTPSLPTRHQTRTSKRRALAASAEFSRVSSTRRFLPATPRRPGKAFSPKKCAGVLFQSHIRRVRRPPLSKRVEFSPCDPAG